jgi:hypothetical protein
MVKTMNEDVRVFGYCEECGRAITDDCEAYVDSDGNYFDCLDCLFEHYDIVKVEP